VPELPDYLPLFLEYLSTRPLSEAVTWLEEMIHLIQLLHARLTEHASPWAEIMRPLLDLAGADPQDPEIREQVANEEPDDTAEALDRVWMEAPVTFGPDAAGEGCSPYASPNNNRVAADPIRWVDGENSENSTLRH